MSSKYIEKFWVIVSVAVSILLERLTDTSCEDFSLWFFGISLTMVKTDIKNVLLKSLFFHNGGAIFFICVIYLLRASFVFKTESSPCVSD